MNKICQEDFNNLFSRGLDYRYFEGKTVLIAGATSFIASYLAEAFLYYNTKFAETSIKLICVVRNRDKAVKRFKRYLEDENFTLIVQDINIPLEFKEDINIIIHAASQASPKYYAIDPVGTFSSNTIGLYNLLETARQKNVADFLFISSSEVYGQTDGGYISEKDYGYLDCTNLRACYSEGKRAGETLCISYAYQYGINTKIARLFHTYGPFMPLDDGRVFADFFNNILNKTDIVMKSDGSAVRTFTYVTDVLDGFLRIILKGEKANAYNISNASQTMPIIKFAKRLVIEFEDRGIKLIKAEEKRDNSYLETLVKKITPNTEKIEKLGFSPQITIEEGFRKLIACAAVDEGKH